MEIHFVGAAGTVTGSKFLMVSGPTKVLIDCGLYQGLKDLRLKNWGDLPFVPEELTAIVLTHGHIDHSGYVPRLIKQGFSGSVYSTGPTRALCEVLLPDCGRINEEDAFYANKAGFSKHKPALPIYTEADARQALKAFRTVAPRRPFEIGEMTFELTEVGHILGACSVTVRQGKKSVCFSGDVGRDNDLVELAPKNNNGADVVVMETTYGDRSHGEEDPIQVIADLVQNTAHRGGMTLIPSFAVGRTQALLYCLWQGFERGYLKRLPVYVDSPMATRVTELYTSFVGWHRLDRDQAQDMCAIADFVGSVDASKGLNQKQDPFVLISASGMLTGGRVLHHLKRRGPQPNNLILLPGFQAAGTRGAKLAGGAKSIKVHGEEVTIAAEVVQLDVFSAHADQNGLESWLKGLQKQPHTVYLVHGEPRARDAFADRLEGQYPKVVCPEFGEVVPV